jgi:hypothetical protein
MKKLLFGLIGVVLAWAGLVSAPDARAQNPTLPPTIITFESDVSAITVADAEAGQMPAHLSWQVVGITGEHRLMLYAYKLNGWSPINPPDPNPRPAAGSQEILVEHPLTFGPPTYSLAIIDGRGQTVDQRVLIIPYTHDPASGPPVIENFTSTVQTLPAGDVGGGRGRVAVGWRVSNRGPLTNLVFEQTLEGGRAVPVELPRLNLWVSSVGEGLLAPVLPSPGEPVRLRLRVVDMRNGDTLAEATLPPITLTGPVPTPVPTAVPAPEARIILFDPAPDTVSRGGTVTVSWEVLNAVKVTVWLLDPDGRLWQSAPASSPTGSWTLALPDYYTDNASFMLFAEDTIGRQAQGSITVLVVCPYTYFFSAAPDAGCPQGDPVTVQAAFQGFEGGYMIWRGDNSEILALYNSGRVERYRDSWRGETVIWNQPPPSPEVYQPVRGFGRVWVDNPALREGLGWALTLEQGYTMSTQQSSSYRYPRLYLNWPDGTVIYIVENTWGFN